MSDILVCSGNQYFIHILRVSESTLKIEGPKALRGDLAAQTHQADPTPGGSQSPEK